MPKLIYAGDVLVTAVLDSPSEIELVVEALTKEAETLESLVVSHGENYSAKERQAMRHRATQMRALLAHLNAPAPESESR